MLDKKKIEKDFKTKAPLYDELREVALYILEKAIKKARVKIQATEDRIKDLSSFFEKAERMQADNQAASIDPMTEIKDILGLRIICYFREDIEKIENLIRQSFEVISHEDKINNQNPDLFGYMSVHFILKLPASCSGPHYDSIKNMVFEIQVRTLAMHCWASISHYLDYKNEQDVPSHLKKSLNALSALFYIADTQFENFAKAKEANIKVLKKAPPSKLAKQEINLDSLATYLKAKFPARKHSAQKLVSALNNELRVNGYKTIEELDTDLNKGIKALPQHETQKGIEYSDIGATRVTLDLLYKSTRRKNKHNRYKRLGIEEFFKTA